jgi:hypothetical protein
MARNKGPCPGGLSRSLRLGVSMLPPKKNSGVGPFELLGLLGSWPMCLGNKSRCACDSVSGRIKAIKAVGHWRGPSPLVALAGLGGF